MLRLHHAQSRTLARFLATSEEGDEMTHALPGSTTALYRQIDELGRQLANERAEREATQTRLQAVEAERDRYKKSIAITDANFRHLQNGRDNLRADLAAAHHANEVQAAALADAVREAETWRTMYRTSDRYTVCAERDSLAAQLADAIRERDEARAWRRDAEAVASDVYAERDALAARNAELTRETARVTAAIGIARQMANCVYNAKQSDWERAKVALVELLPQFDAALAQSPTTEGEK